MFVIYEMLDSVASSSMYSICFIIGIELVGPKCRVLSCSIITIFYAFGEVILALAAKYYQNWRILLRFMYTPAIVMIFYVFLLPESIRWLLSQGRTEDAIAILKKAAEINKHSISDNILMQLSTNNHIKYERYAAEVPFPYKEAFQKYFGRIINCAFCWIVNVFVYYGLSLNSISLPGDRYINFLLIAAIEVPGFLLPLITMNCLGRRYTLFSYMCMSGLCCFLTVFTSAGKFFIKCS